MIVPEPEKLLVLALLGIVLLFVYLIAELFLRRRKQKELLENMGTPVTKEGLEQYDDLQPGEAVLLAWSEPGNFPQWHRQMQNEVRKNMPVLARALDRMVEN